MFKKTLTALALSAGLILCGNSDNSSYLNPGFNPAVAQAQELEMVKKPKDFPNGLENRIEGLLKKRTIDCVRIAGTHGGYLALPNEYYDGKYFTLPYLYDKGTVEVPKKEKIEEQFSKYISYSVYHGLSDFKYSDWKMYSKRPDVVTKIGDESVEVSMKIQLYLRYKSELELFKLREGYKTRIDVRLGKILDVSKDIAQRIARKKDPLTMKELTYPPFTMMVFRSDDDKDKIIYGITDYSKDKSLEGVPLSLMFGTRFGNRIGNDNIRIMESVLNLGRDKEKMKKFDVFLKAVIDGKLE